MKVSHAKIYQCISFFLILSVFVTTLTSCNNGNFKTAVVQKTELTLTQLVATQELTLASPTEVATEMPTITLTPEPSPTATVEVAPINMDKVIDLTKLSPEQIAIVNEEMIKRIEQFKKGEICSAELVKEKGFATSPDSPEREIHLGLIFGGEENASMQVCILGNIIKYNNDIYGKQFEYIYQIIGYEEKDGSRTSTVVSYQLGKNILSNSPTFAVAYDLYKKLGHGIDYSTQLLKERSQIISFLNSIQNNVINNENDVCTF